MTENDVSSPSASSSKTSPKNTTTKKSTTKTSAKEKTRLPTSEMVNASLAALKERNGSSLQAIKKYITATYNIDAEKQSVYIRKYLKSAVEKNIIIQTKGVGANGRFKLAENVDKEKKKKGRKSTPKKSTTSAEETETAAETSTG